MKNNSGLAAIEVICFRLFRLFVIIFEQCRHIVWHKYRRAVGCGDYHATGRSFDWIWHYYKATACVICCYKFGQHS